VSGREWRPDTRAVRAGLSRTPYDETAEALFLTSGYVYPEAAEAERAFAGESEHYMYSRFTNPTQTALAERLCALEGAESCYPTATGMAAVFNALMALVRAGDRVVSARSLFGSCFNVVHDLLPRWGVEVEFVDGHDLAQWEQALRRPARAVFFETPSNPMHELVDVAAVAELAHAVGAVVVVDNAFASPALQRPLALGADVVAYSATKHMDGQGRVLGGAILGSEEFVQGEVKTLMRNTGPTLSPFNAWVILKGLETLRLRVEHASRNALDLAGWLQEQSGVRWVRYPFLESHPQYALAQTQMSGGGTIVTFEVEGGKERAFAVLDALELVDISNNFGDAKSLITHPATTTHHKMGPEARAAIGVTDGVIRLSVGLEDVEDLREDLARSLGGR